MRCVACVGAGDIAVSELTFPKWLDFAFGTSETAPGGEEGGFNANDPSTENPTFRGIELNEWRKWRGDMSLTGADMRAQLRRTEIAALTHAWYWVPAQVRIVPTGLDLLYADHCFNAGQGGGVRCLQAAINAIGKNKLAVDGALGPITQRAMLALTATDALPLLDALHKAIAADYRSMAKFPEFGSDWLGRNDRATFLAMRLAGAA